MKGGGRAGHPSPAWANFTLLMECMPESSRCYSVYSVVKCPKLYIPSKILLGSCEGTWVLGGGGGANDAKNTILRSSSACSLAVLASYALIITSGASIY